MNSIAEHKIFTPFTIGRVSLRHRVMSLSIAAIQAMPPSAWVVIDIVRMESGILAEHWDVIQDEATEADSKSGKPMFGNSFPAPTAK
jgi:predicted SnoaL-like aldol condensation-catalyzing enzyme